MDCIVCTCCRRYSNFTKSGGEAYLFAQAQVPVPVEEYKAAVTVSDVSTSADSACLVNLWSPQQRSASYCQCNARCNEWLTKFVYLAVSYESYLVTFLCKM